MSEKIIFSSDSTTDLGPELKERYNIHILPLSVTLGDDMFKDGVDIDAEKIYDYHSKTGILPKTSAVNVEEYLDYFKSIKEEGAAIIHFSLGSDLSSSCNNAFIAASEFEDVYVVDTKNLSTGGGLMVLAACDLAEQGLSAKEIAETVQNMWNRVDASFVIDSLEYLYKGGRCSALSVLGANLLKLKPCIEVKNGKMGVGKKYRGKYAEVLKEYVKERLENIEGIEKNRVFITHAGCDEAIVKELVELVRGYNYFDEVFSTRASCTISSHCGRNTLGILFIRKSPIS
ncbi:MAG TPA: DegV family protein [Ruminococcaceae bacterium]|nr:DegV family protein [Oscillospiraceae bacterium]